MNLVLASGSPRRRDLLRASGYVIDEISPSHIPEQRRPDEDPKEYTARLAHHKALDQARPNFVLGPTQGPPAIQSLRKTQRRHGRAFYASITLGKLALGDHQLESGTCHRVRTLDSLWTMHLIGLISSTSTSRNRRLRGQWRR